MFSQEVKWVACSQDGQPRLIFGGLLKTDGKCAELGETTNRPDWLKRGTAAVLSDLP